MELKDFSVLFSMEYCATELTGVILHGSTPTFRTFVMAKKGISLYWARLKLRENTPFVVELLASGASQRVEIISKGKPFFAFIQGNLIGAGREGSRFFFQICQYLR